MKRAIMILALTAFEVTGCRVAHSEAAMPRYDVAAHCRAVASAGGSYSAVLDKSCTEMEQQAYDALKPLWPQTGAAGTHCDRVARVGGPGSYWLLKGCIDMETQAGQAKPKFKF